MKLYTIEHAGRELVCVEGTAGLLTALPYEGMNDLLADDPAHRAEVLARYAAEPGTLTADRILAPIPRPRQDIICLGMN